MDRRDPLPVRRSLMAGLLAAAVVGGVLLLVRPFIFTFAPPLGDANYTVASAAAIRNGPALVEIVLNESHDLPGEVHRDEAVGLTVVVSAVGGDAFAVVDAWSPTNDCALTLAADRVIDCAGDTWTFDGVPIDPADPALLAFPTTVSNGAVVVDFTRPISPPAS
ncbi:MAG: hypothetical protein M3550_07240 [Actinomycetota bacterium]|nr:hypothetical protein [Actinomycetota bacterium]